MDLAALVGRYAARFAALGDDTHQVGSPLGAWLVLAMAGPAAVGAVREEISDALGTDIDSAQRLFAQLLDEPHPAVATALAAWTAPWLVGLDSWRDRLPPRVTTGGIPTGEQVDEWARTHTMGMIESLPVDGLRDVVVLLASALATRVTWLTPFDRVDASQLRGRWGERLSHVLRSPPRGGHRCFIATTQQAGTVAVHTAIADNHLEVTSLIAAPDVSRVDVLAAAHDIAALGYHGAAGSTVSLFDLQLGASPLWTIVEHEAHERGEHAEAALPAWHAQSQHDLLKVPDLAFGAAAEAMMSAAHVRGPVAAAQSAVAAYSRTGFEAAAVTGFGIATGMRMPPPPGPYRTATLHFGHPYAVVATTRARPDSPWNGLPVFAAWITQPDDAD